jgi:ribosomal protein S25
MQGFEKRVTKMDLITQTTVASDLKVTGSIARLGIAYLASQGLIQKVSSHSRLKIYVPLKTTTSEKTTVVINNKKE